MALAVLLAPPPPLATIQPNTALLVETVVTLFVESSQYTLAPVAALFRLVTS